MKNTLLILVLGFSLMNFSPKPAVTNSPLAKQNPTDITGIRWKLTELSGKPVKSNDEKDYFIEFKPDNNFKAYAGCNNMSGHYEYRENRIHFMRIVGTMKACPNTEAEESLKAALETVDNFTKNGKVLQFRKGETFLAKFEAVPLVK